MWHFAETNSDDVPVLGYGDGREIKVGETLTVDCDPILCERGLHASERLIDALSYAKGDKICRVELGGTVVHDTDKAVGTERTCLAMIDGEELLREFARSCALQVIVDLQETPDIVRQYLESGDESIRDAARNAARNAALDAARYAARNAARNAAWDATLDAAWYAARNAARYAALDDARDAQDKKLTEMVEAAMEHCPDPVSG